MRTTSSLKKQWSGIFLAIMMVLILVGCGTKTNQSLSSNTSSQQTTQQTQQTGYTVSSEEKEYLTNKFASLKATNDDTIGYIYAPGTQLDEPIVQTTDNETYLDKTFEGANEPLMGTVFMDMDNNKNFSDSLTWLFGHARGSQVADHRMFNDVNYYDQQAYMDEHPYVVIETPERKYYYEVAFLIIVPETTAFYRTSFDNTAQFEEQLKEVREKAHTQNKEVEIKSSDKYVVLSTCREDDVTIRANLYLRQIPDSELTTFLKENGEKLVYTPTR